MTTFKNRITVCAENLIAETIIYKKSCNVESCNGRNAYFPYQQNYFTTCNSLISIYLIETDNIY